MLVLGVDVGTTACKAVLLNEHARVIAEADHPHDLHSPQPGWAEEDPADWWRGTVATANEVLAGQDPAAVHAVGVSGMVPALVEVLCLLLPLGTDRVALLATGRAWTLDEPEPSVDGEDDPRRPILLIVTADVLQ